MASAPPVIRLPLLSQRGRLFLALAIRSVKSISHINLAIFDNFSLFLISQFCCSYNFTPLFSLLKVNFFQKPALFLARMLL